jgi:hypothetical protein
VRGRNRRPTILALRTESRIWARAVEAKNSANGKGRRPFWTCSTQEEFAMYAIIVKPDNAAVSM